MKPQPTSFQEFLSILRQTWRATGVFFASIEVWLMLLMAVLAVAGVWLSFGGELLGPALLATVLAYMVARPVLHIKGILGWPFI